MSKSQQHRSIFRDYLYLLVIIICIGYWTFKNVISTPLTVETVTSEPQYEINTENKSGGICDICGKTFHNRGYQEISEGQWQETQLPYQTFICSKSCGLKHTAKWNKILSNK